jgi:CRP-like cAMP-binding protein
MTRSEQILRVILKSGAYEVELQRADRCQHRPVSSGLDANAQALGRIPLFEGLPTKEIQALAQQSRSRRYAAKESILTQDDATRDVFFIIGGRVRVSAFSASGREVSYRDLSAGRMFGELAAIDGQTRSATVIALEDTSVVQLSASAFCTVLERHPQVANAMLCRLTGLVRALSDRVFEFGTLDVRHRIHAELLRLARDEGIRKDGRVMIARSPKHSELASRVSTHREAITREMRALARAKIIERAGGALIIRDIERLASLLADGMDE